MSDDRRLVEEYAAVASLRATRITALVQERDALARRVAALPTRDQSVRTRQLERKVAELESEVLRLRGRLRRYEKARQQVESFLGGRALLAIVRQVRRSTAGGRTK